MRRDASFPPLQVLVDPAAPWGWPAVELYKAAPDTRGPCELVIENEYADESGGSRRCEANRFQLLRRVKADSESEKTK